ncbi:DUF2849 domain-containing protein [Palleronia caenipelagi]|uniref:DUF2849 domain-containing protein n=1 Tax=Palleronia caenipelagi TaxID=2489174 RepID=A0A547QAT9_9RHOB|nr:DUF2849 domain-containing protein [Palleronia caenipelagi]TRD23513.1 DUF2849 domain-containing protein [Palleronia caenipelagi]
MPRPFTPKVVTANHLMRGDAIWLTAEGDWSADISEAELIETEARAEARLALAAAQPEIAVGPYLADAKAGATGPEPTHFREVFRTRGPSNYAHGKQERA